MMKRLLTPLALFAVFLVAGCETPTGDSSMEEAAAPLDAQAQSALAALPAEASFLAVADAQAIQRSGAFKKQDEEHDFTGETGARLKDFLDATGFDPAKDVQKVYLANPDGSKVLPQLVVAANFDRARFQDQLENGDLSTLFDKTTYRGQPLYQRTREEDTFSFTFTPDGLILFAPRPEGVRQMIDRLETDASSITDDDETMRLADQVRGHGDTWFVARGLQATKLPFRTDSTSSDPRSEQLDRIARIIEQSAGALSVSESTADGELFLYTHDSADTADLKEALEGLVAVLSSREDLSTEKRRTLESIEIEEAGEAVYVSFSVAMNHSQ